MPLRVISRSSLKKDETIPKVQAAAEPHGFWRTGFLLITSAACGGIAVAIWHRRTLALMRTESDPAGSALHPPVKDDQQ